MNSDGILAIIIFVLFGLPVIALLVFLVKQEHKKRNTPKDDLAEAAKGGLHIDMDAYDAAQQPRPMGDSEPKLVCPRCGCSQLYAGKKGFSAGKAITGAFIAGPVGLVGGAIGQNKVIVTCLSCGHKWKV